MDINKIQKIARLVKIKLSKVPDIVYHVSPKDFNEFEQQARGGLRASDLGFHFGNENTVKGILKHISQEGHHGGWKKGDDLYKYSVKLNMKSPLRLSENRLGSWSAVAIVQEIMEREPQIKGITDSMVDDYYDDRIYLKNKKEWWEDSSHSEEELMKNTVKWIKELGYDGIVYNNSYEGGGDSYIAFDQSQIKIIKKEKI